MTVADLIAKLETFPADAKVAVDDDGVLRAPDAELEDTSQRLPGLARGYTGQVVVL